MTKADFFRRFSPWVNALALLGLLLLVLPNSDALAAPAKRNVSFDHIKTGFPLTGAHVTLPCETCHIQGVFKGTPKKCAACHTPGSRFQTSTFKTSKHIVTAQACDQCHTSTASWNVALFSHAGVTPHQCRQCHNNSIVKGKAANHPPTDAPCDACHRTTTWMSASFTHVSVSPGSCATCHVAGGSGQAKTSGHIPTNLSCDSCHSTGGSFKASKFTHSAAQGAMTGQCATCHNGSYTGMNALGKAQASSPHVATSASCDTCHTGYASFKINGSAFTHSGVSPGSCTNCHVMGGTAKTSKPTDHMPTALACDKCHTTGGTFTTSTFTHSATQGVIAGQCATCHNGSYTKWNALGKSSNHIPTTLSCDACHANGGAFKPSKFTHSAAQGVLPLQCETCHNGAYTGMNALGKAQASPPHVTTTASCDTCHKGYATFAGLSGTAFNHASVTPGTCTSCHIQGGSATTFKPADHVPTNLSCDACHTTGGSFTTSRFTHSATQGIQPGQCATCHSGTYTKWNALGKPSNHIPTSNSCEVCHTTGGTFTTSTFTHTAAQGVVAGQCANCHNGSYTQWNALGKAQASPTHVTTTAACDTCHKGYATFAGATFSHTGVTPGSCTTCHIQGGSATTFKPANHIPTTLSCENCHSTGGTFSTSTFTHSATQGVVAGQCGTSCHNGSYAIWNALGKPSNHIPTTLSCENCHSTGGTFTTSTFKHTAAQGVVAGQCANCHNGSYTQWNALGKASASPPHVSTTASCDTCHSGYASFAGATFNHTGVTPGTCSSCHYQGGTGKPKPTNHIPYESQLLAGSSMNCDSCHKNTNPGGFASQTMNHNSSLGNGAGWCKGCHASGTTFLGNMLKKSLTHYEKYQGQTDCSQSGCHRPLGTQGTPYSRWTN
jgi:hypothetical protein